MHSSASSKMLKPSWSLSWRSLLRNGRLKNVVIVEKKDLLRGLVLRGRPMSEQIPSRKPPSKPKEDDREFLGLLLRKPPKSK